MVQLLTHRTAPPAIKITYPLNWYTTKHGGSSHMHAVGRVLYSNIPTSILESPLPTTSADDIYPRTTNPTIIHQIVSAQAVRRYSVGTKNRELVQKNPANGRNSSLKGAVGEMDWDSGEDCPAAIGVATFGVFFIHQRTNAHTHAHKHTNINTQKCAMEKKTGHKRIHTTEFARQTNTHTSTMKQSHTTNGKKNAPTQEHTQTHTSRKNAAQPNCPNNTK